MFTFYKRRGTAWLTAIVAGLSYVQELPSNGGLQYNFPVRCRASRISGLWRVCRIAEYESALTDEELGPPL
jgi:hypothetical protein